MDEGIRWLSGKLSSRASRRGFLGFAGSATLGAGLALHGLSISQATGCYGCGSCSGGQCSSPAPPCSGCLGEYGTDCPSGCTLMGTWACCVTIYGGACTWYCTECCCNGSGCTCFGNTGSPCGAPGCAFRPVRSEPVRVQER